MYLLKISIQYVVDLETFLHIINFSYMYISPQLSSTVREPHVLIVYDKIKQPTLEGWFHLSDLHDDHKSPQLCLSYRKDTIIHNYKKCIYVLPQYVFEFYTPIFYWGTCTYCTNRDKSSQDLKNRILHWIINIILQMYL